MNAKHQLPSLPIQEIERIKFTIAGPRRPVEPTEVLAFLTILCARTVNCYSADNAGGASVSPTALATPVPRPSGKAVAAPAKEIPKPARPAGSLSETTSRHSQWEPADTSPHET
ncbi:MAG: hypothetical protein H5T86_02060 [Armatimonadetes bacterium]|nr:hypothetical protein [Armatimonadota bacterium]